MRKFLSKEEKKELLRDLFNEILDAVEEKNYEKELPRLIHILSHAMSDPAITATALHAAAHKKGLVEVVEQELDQ